MRFIQDVSISFVREMRPTLRTGFVEIAFTLLQPFLYLLLFVPMLGDFSPVVGQSPLQWFVPGMIVMLCLFGTASCGWSMADEFFSGTFERILATPLSRPAMLLGRTFKALVPLLLQALIIIIVSLPFGLQLHMLAMLVGLAFLLVFGTGVAALSHALAIAARNSSGGSLFWLVTQTINLPLMLLGGVLLPMEVAPRWLYVASRFNPLAYLVEAERALFSGHILTGSVLLGAIVAVLTAAFGLFIGVRTINRASL